MQNYNATLLQDVTIIEELLHPGQNSAWANRPPPFTVIHYRKPSLMETRTFARQVTAFAASSLLLFPLLSIPAQAHEAHVHGVGKLDVALDGNTLSLHLDSPLVNLIGFEHTASSPKDRQAAQDMAKALRNAGKIFVTSAAAACTVSQVKLVSAAITPTLLGETASAPKAGAHEDHDGHADIDADFVFQCAAPERLQQIDVKLFDAFKGFVSIDVQLVTPKRQAAAKLTLSSSVINLQ